MKQIIVGITTALIVTGCGVQEAPPEDSSTAPTLEAVTDTLGAVVGKDVPAAETMNIPALKGAVEVGQSVTLEGKVMGSDQPFVNGHAVMLVGDEATIESCDVLPDDPCKTPWDVCCVDPKTILAGTATVQVVNAEGKPVAVGLKGVEGLKELSRVRVSGTVAPGSSKDVLVVNADAIQVL